MSAQRRVKRQFRTEAAMWTAATLAAQRCKTFQLAKTINRLPKKPMSQLVLKQLGLAD